MRLSDYKGEEALDVLADIIEPLTYILSDDEIQQLQKSEVPQPIIKFVKPAIKNHKKELIQILARLNNEAPEEYEQKVNLITLPMQVLELINDPEIQSLFQSQSQIQLTPLASSGSVTENTEAEEQ